ncbi:DNA polymerase Y family protein [Paracoccus sp. 2205BS29-5]|uniref:DNA-directed DNA polymerase n=2 Tax=Paracoccus spongiarum TaxID=3064387 RepID=A0ABT9JCM9_9RHOB|nr:DNA polymerase Y family protein [Paracoccus sp. 2205BS29-5]MDP5307570.1 DNA polymerase Y family protein [Paracoccus sp. 2205BS29-5]
MGEAVSDDTPVVLWAEGSHGPVVHDLNRAARMAGVRRGARLADMRALCPVLQAVPAELQGDSAALVRLMFWARRWGPFSATDGNDGLVVDTTGTAHLFGGEDALLADMQARLARAGLTARVALAPTWGAAWGLSRYGAERSVCHDLADLHPLPVAALRLSDDTLLLLRRLGLRRIGDLAAMPRLTLMRRFARAPIRDNPLTRLDQAMGQLAEPVAAPDPPPDFMAEARLAEPVFDPTDWLPGLVDELARKMAEQDRGCRRLCLSVFRVDGERRDIRVATAAPSREAAHLLRLFAGRLDHLDPGYGFDLIRLLAETTEPLATAQVSLEGNADTALHLSRLIDRLVARFGPDAIVRPVPMESHIPERSEGRAEAMRTDPPPAPRPDRPIRLFDRPEEVRVLYALPDGPPALFIWRRQQISVARHAGPERIAPEWWRDGAGARLRDYYRIEDATGRRLWLYREGLEGDGRGGLPRWFIHGVFA